MHFIEKEKKKKTKKKNKKTSGLTTELQLYNRRLSEVAPYK